MRVFRSGLAFVIGAAFLNLMVARLNNGILPLHLFCAGLFAAYGAFHLHPRAGFAGVFVIGLLMDARAPVPFGTQAVLLAALHTLLSAARDRVDRNSDTARILAAVLANLVFSLALALLCVRRAALQPLPLLGDLLLSQALVALVTPWYFALQSRLVRLAAPADGGSHIHRTRADWLAK
ncbi:MAG: hypothetical protein LBR12_02870 [Opitutaceae bacterium]|jgi:rod shape-determining protein MreD|nr:hypothetical protein [Opitutaceae bacterium]